jgi:tetratricopeptide (TPR) repeat protein
MVSIYTAPKLVLFAFTVVSGLPAETPAPKPSLPPESKGDILMARKMYREAIDTYALAPENSPSRWNKMGIAYHQLADLPKAKKEYERALRVDPNYGEAINNLGTIYYAEKSYRRAIREYKRSLRAMPDSATVYSNLGTAYFARKDYPHASDAYQKALQLDPDIFEHHNSYGVLLQDHSVADRARFHYYLAKMYAKQGMPDRALQCVRKAIEEGFGERQRFIEEPEFAVLKDNVEFQQILKSEPRVL